MDIISSTLFGIIHLNCLNFSSDENQNHMVFWENKKKVAQLDACRNGDQEVAGSTFAVSATFFHGD